MISFKYINKEKIKKIGSAILLTTFLTTTSFTLTSCGQDITNNNEIETIIEDNRKDYGVVLENDIACIYELTRWSHLNGGRYYFIEDDNKEVVLSASIVHGLMNYTIEEAEEYAKNLLTENGVIRYYNVEGKENPKALKKIK